ncbi:MAG: protein kinase, partial [Cyanobacteria bacterium NC_groundwater_1444_Ag_S-0.65um_54_12]|nr:protein kinase [Cyanobacteria bacterium NC_groundwater_1444_Ag_S-0.65um_54_12]
MSFIPSNYECLELLGKGAASSVWRVSDRSTGEQLALKLLEEDDKTACLRFQQEYWFMLRLSHPGLVQAKNFGWWNNRPYLTMQLVDGPAVSAVTNMAIEELRRIILGLCPILSYLHAQGLVHGDLKPQNLHFDSSGRLYLLDLGFLQQAGHSGVRRGTLGYMAPEILRGAPADPRSDLWAVGVIAYELLTGSLPFAATHPLDLLAAQLVGARPTLASQRPDLPWRVIQAIEACLESEPENRPASVEQFLAQLGWGEGTPAHLFFGSTICGRGSELTELMTELATAFALNGVTITLAGSAGLGKSRLSQELVAYARELNHAVLAVNGRSEQPFGLLLAILHAAESFLADDALALGTADPRWQALRALMPRWGEPPPPIDPASQQIRLRQAIALLLAAISQANGLLVAIDDWDQADAASRDLLDPLLRRNEQAGLVWLITQSAALSASGNGLQLQPLTLEATRELLRSTLLHEPAERLVGLAHKITKGNPAQLRRLLVNWRNSGLLKHEAGNWRICEEKITVLADTILLPPGDELLQLSADARQVAIIGAILGSEFSLEEIASLYDGDLFAGITELEASNLLERSAERYSFSGQSRLEVLAGLAADERNFWHARVARMLAPRTDLAGLTLAARHHSRAQTKEAASYCLRAAAAHLALGGIATARSLLQELTDLAKLPEEEQEYLRLLGDLARARGAVETALNYYDRAIELARQLGDTQALCRELVSAGRAAMVLSNAELARRFLFEACTLCKELGNLAQESRALMTLGRVAFFAGDRAAALADFSAARALAELAGDNALLADALGFLGAMSDPADPQGQAFLVEAVEYQRQILNPLGLLEALINLGDRRLAAGD